MTKTAPSQREKISLQSPRVRCVIALSILYILSPPFYEHFTHPDRVTGGSASHLKPGSHSLGQIDVYAPLCMAVCYSNTLGLMYDLYFESVNVMLFGQPTEEPGQDLVILANPASETSISLDAWDLEELTRWRSPSQQELAQVQTGIDNFYSATFEPYVEPIFRDLYRVRPAGGHRAGGRGLFPASGGNLFSVLGNRSYANN